MGALVSVVDELATSANASGYSGNPVLTVQAGDLLVAFVVVTATASAGSFTDNQGIAWTQVITATKNAGADKLWLFVRDGPITLPLLDGFFQAFIDVTGDNGTGCVMFIAGVEGISRFGASSIRQSAVQSNQAAGTPAPSFARSANARNVILGFVANASNPAGLTPPAILFEPPLGDLGYNTPVTGGEYGWQDAFFNSVPGFNGQTVTWGSASATPFGSIIVELRCTPVDPVGYGVTPIPRV